MKFKRLFILPAFLFFLSFNTALAAGVEGVATCDTAKEVCIDNPLGKTIDTPQKFIGNIIKALLGVIGSIALIMFVYGGFMWMTAAGDKNKVTKGMDTMLWAVLGLTVIFSSYALVRFVIEKVGS
jgi:hypothetical protein